MNPRCPAMATSGIFFNSKLGRNDPFMINIYRHSLL